MIRQSALYHSQMRALKAIGDIGRIGLAGFGIVRIVFVERCNFFNRISRISDLASIQIKDHFGLHLFDHAVGSYRGQIDRSKCNRHILLQVLVMDCGKCIGITVIGPAGHCFGFKLRCVIYDRERMFFVIRCAVRHEVLIVV